MEYKVGDKVRIVSKKVGSQWNSNGLMDKWLGKVMTVRLVCDSCYKMEEDIREWGDGWTWYPWMIEGIAGFTKSDLVPGQHMIEVRSGGLYLCLRDSNGNLFFSSVFGNVLSDSFNDDLKNKYNIYCDVMKVYEFSGHIIWAPEKNRRLIWERKPKIQKPKQLENIVDPCDFFKEV